MTERDTCSGQPFFLNTCPEQQKTAAQNNCRVMSLPQFHLAVTSTTKPNKTKSGSFFLRTNLFHTICQEFI